MYHYKHGKEKKGKTKRVQNLEKQKKHLPNLKCHTCIRMMFAPFAWAALTNLNGKNYKFNSQDNCFRQKIGAWGRANITLSQG